MQWKHMTDMVRGRGTRKEREETLSQMSRFLGEFYFLRPHSACESPVMEDLRWLQHATANFQASSQVRWLILYVPP